MQSRNIIAPQDTKMMEDTVVETKASRTGLGRRLVGSFRKSLSGRKKVHFSKQERLLRKRSSDNNRRMDTQSSRSNVVSFRISSPTSRDQPTALFEEASCSSSTDDVGDHHEPQMTKNEQRPYESSERLSVAKSREDVELARSSTGSNVSPDMVEELMDRSMKYLVLKQENQVLLDELERLRAMVPAQEESIDELKRQARSQKWNAHLTKHNSFQEDVISCLLSNWGLAVLLVCSLTHFFGVLA